MRVRVLALPVIVLLLLAACGSDKKSGTTSGATGTVTVFNAMEPEEVTALQKVVNDLINSKVKYTATIEGSSQFEEQIKIRVQGGNPPEIAMYPQPGTVVELAKQGKIVALEDMGFNVGDLETTFGTYFMSLGAYNGKHYGLPTNINLKSMIWYPKKAFDLKGYKVPTTWNELIALSDQIVKDGSSPWCVGFESGSATGWPATDWMEDLMLRTAGPATYDKWVTHQIPFNDPSVLKAGNFLGQVLFTPNYVLGGAANTTWINFGDAVGPMFSNPPKCWFNQANFIASFFPKTAVAGVDYDWFPFPTVDLPGSSALFAGELSVVFKDTPAVRDFLTRFAGTEVQCAQGKSVATSRISPNVNVGANCYANKQLADASSVLTAALKADNARFDASDLMPSAVGSGSFWTGMVKYVQGGPAAGPVPRGRAALRVRRARAGDPRRLPDLPGRQHGADQLQGRPLPAVRRAGQLPVRVDRRQHAALDPQHAGLDRAGAAGRREHRLAVRHPGRPAAAGRGGGQVDDLPTDGGLVRGAAVVWRFVYSFRPEGFGSNIGLLNAVKQGLGQDPVPWLQERPWNNLLLMVIMVWMQTGFAMVVLSAAIKAIPDEILEAARIDGASEFQVFRRIIIPTSCRPSSWSRPTW